MAAMFRRYRLALGVVAGLVVGAFVYVRRTLPPSGAKVRTLSSGGAQRSYVVYPGSAAKKHALVLVLHGRGGSGAAFERRTKRMFDTLADREGFVVVYPNALGSRWNDGASPREGGQEHPADDVAFLSAIADSVSKEYAIDPARVYATGFSNGAAMVYRLACERENQFAAIAPVSGGMFGSVAERCRDGRPISVLIMHGTKDPIVAYEPNVRDPLRAWTTRDGCSAPELENLPDLDGNDGARARVERYSACKGGSEVTLYAIEGGGHTWPGGENTKLTSDVGNACRDFDAAIAIWDFFKRHPWP
jgi:polyhydroxybutyrate depolymerase